MCVICKVVSVTILFDGVIFVVLNVIGRGVRQLHAFIETIALPRFLPVSLREFVTVAIVSTVE